ncbi:hypothetical protein [Dyella flagellata]|uniref:Uncharacterized protein n=1 Tax=Dyella flagellata TaxID=1867833 RepID=A0ABQ5XCA9_9GAMM|nr:hypothetical protein [Dyella flagellata]GLQ89335.1 hypothetical protein GCM10007898_29080 [Dyella flagellata]
MSIRNATIARRSRKIGLSEQERLALDSRRRRHHDNSGQQAKPHRGLSLPRPEKTGSWQANWAEW